jgi:hypothetical protein
LRNGIVLNGSRLGSINRLRNLCCGHLPSRDGRDELHKLRCGLVFSRSWCELGVNVRILLGRNLSTRDGRVGVQLVFGGHLVGRNGVKHTVRSVFGWEVRVECRRVCLLGLRGGQLLWR